MNQRIEVELDDQGRLVIPHVLQEQLGIVSGSTLVVERETETAAFLRVQPTQPRVIDKDGILVVQADIAGDITNIVQDEREQRNKTLMQQVGL